MINSTNQLLVGVGRRCINPPPNIAHGGWGAQKHEQAEGIDMDLWVTALALSDEKTTAIVLDVDIQIITNQRGDEIRAAVSKATGLPIQNICACATHTHSGPVPYKSWIEKGYEMVAPWFENVARWSAEAASEALANLQPVEVRAGRGECHINTNRRATAPDGKLFLGVNPNGACDHEVIVVRFDAANWDLLATLVNFTCHATIMGPPNRLITPDYPGAMKRVVEKALGGKCLFLQGSAGDQGPVQGFIKDTSVYKNLGGILGLEAAKVAMELKSIPPKMKFREVIPSGAPLGSYDVEFPAMRGTPVQVVDKEIFVPLREGLPEKKSAEEKLEFWKAKLKAAREQLSNLTTTPLPSLSSPSEGEERVAVGRERSGSLAERIADAEAAITEATYMARRADIQLRMADDFGGKTSAGVRAHFITFGDFALVGCNIEPFCEIGMAIKKQSPFPVTFMCGYTNGRMAYMPTADEWTRGGYEVENSPFGQNAAEVLQREILETLHSLC